MPARRRTRASRRAGSASYTGETVALQNTTMLTRYRPDVDVSWNADADSGTPGTFDAAVGYDGADDQRPWRPQTVTR